MVRSNRRKCIGHKRPMYSKSLPTIKCTVVCSTYTVRVFLCMSCVIKNCIEQFNLGQPKQGNIPMGGGNEGVYKHSAGEGWASNINTQTGNMGLG